MKIFQNLASLVDQFRDESIERLVSFLASFRINRIEIGEVVIELGQALAQLLGFRGLKGRDILYVL